MASEVVPDSDEIIRLSGPNGTDWTVESLDGAYSGLKATVSTP